MASIAGVLLGLTLLVCFFAFLILALRRLRAAHIKINYLMATATRKRREMATYGVKPNPPFFRSELRKSANQRISAEIEAKQQPSFRTRLAYAFEVYDPLFCSLHRLTRQCRAAKKRKAPSSDLQTPG